MTKGINLGVGVTLKGEDARDGLSLPLRLKTPRRFETSLAGKIVFVFPVNAKVYPLVARRIGRPRADRQCVLCVCGMLQFLDCLRAVDADFWFETVQKSEIRDEIERCDDNAKAQEWRSISPELYRLWGVMDMSQLKMFSALFNTQLNTLNPETDGDSSETRRPRKRQKTHVVSIDDDPMTMAVSCKAIVSVEWWVFLLHMVFDSEKKLIPKAKSVTFEMTEPQAEVLGQDTNEVLVTGGMSFAQSYYSDDDIDVEPQEHTGGAVNETVSSDGMLSLPDTHVLSCFQAHKVFASKAHTRQLEKGNCLPYQCDITNYIVEGENSSVLRFDERYGGPVRSCEDFDWLRHTDDIKQYGLFENEPSFAEIHHHLCKIAFTTNMDPDEDVPKTYDQLIDALENNDMCDPTEAGNPWKLASRLSVDNAATSSVAWAPHQELLIGSIYGGVYAAKQRVCRIFQISNCTSEMTDKIIKTIWYQAWHGVCNTVGDSIPQIFPRVYAHTKEVKSAIDSPQTPAGVYARKMVRTPVAEHKQRLKATMGLSTDEEVGSVTLSTMFMVWSWCMTKMFNLSDQQSAIVVALWDAQGVIPFITTTGSNVVFMLLGKYGLGKSFLCRIAASALCPFAVKDVTSKTSLSRLTINAHIMTIVDDAQAVKSDEGHDPIRNELQSSGVACRERQEFDPDIGTFKTVKAVGVSRGEMTVEIHNNKPDGAARDRATSVIDVPKPVKPKRGVVQIGELAAGSISSDGGPATKLVLQEERGELYACWSVHATGPVEIDETMFRVAIAVTRKMYADENVIFDNILSARKIEHALTLARCHMAHEHCRYMTFFGRDTPELYKFKKRMVKIISGQHAMRAITSMINEQTLSMSTSLLIVGYLKHRVKMKSTRMEVDYDENSNHYVALEISGSKNDAIISALASDIPDYTKATVVSAFEQLQSRWKVVNGGTQLIRHVTQSNGGSYWFVHRDLIFDAEAISDTERSIWTALKYWLDKSAETGFSAGLVRLSYDCKRYVFLQPAVRALRTPKHAKATGVDVPDCILKIGEDTALQALTVMNQCKFSSGGDGLKVSASRSGELSKFAEETAIFGTIQPDDTWVECDPNGPECKLLKQNDAIPLYKKCKTPMAGTQNVSIAISDLDRIFHRMTNSCDLPRALLRAWNTTLRCEGSVPDKSIVGVIVDSSKPKMGTNIMVTDYSTVQDDIVPTPGYAATAATAFAPSSSTMANTVLPLAPTIDTSEHANYAEISKTTFKHKYNLDESHFTPVLLRDL